MQSPHTISVDLSRERRKKWRTTRLAWGLLLPSMIFLAIFTFYPIGYSVYMSLFKNNMSTVMTGPKFIGFQNYVTLFTKDTIFTQSFINNLIVAVVIVPVSIALAVGMAIFANKVKLGKGAVRVSFFYPTLLPMVAVANIWLFIYTPMYGLLGYINSSWRFLGHPDTVLGALIVMLIWKQAGYVMIFYISGLQNINYELYEAARIDGANSRQTFLRITWPMLKPTTLYVMIITLTNAYKMVDHLYIMTKGGPGNASNMLLFYVYQKAFDQSNTGVASAITVVLISLLLIITCVHFFTQDRKIFYA
ncbi:MAG: sugar ABC transporter permease [Eubacteriales bacterium]|jgi:sn-glycerol 3-phosphate transport system permease protein|nr:sugar ABC transporter permease [Eubacteriales bacterium]MDD4106168.1 sugar ABC transporter permease [Eubacteriales bacterium]MDD4711437.1 sugar ABC transporter permease [Eubacteriales bacterium]NLO16067.1 sugar ABC transporter permease [Clostridiales bacterium]